jgi:hypothetical protein
MKIKNIKEEVTQDMENLKKRESNRNTKHSGRPLQQTRTNQTQTNDLMRPNVSWPQHWVFWR